MADLEYYSDSTIYESDQELGMNPEHIIRKNKINNNIVDLTQDELDTIIIIRNINEENRIRRTRRRYYFEYSNRRQTIIGNRSNNSVNWESLNSYIPTANELFDQLNNNNVIDLTNSDNELEDFMPPRRRRRNN